jgi:hypothetical protein
MELSKIKLPKSYNRYSMSFREAIEAETGLKIEDILAKFKALNYSYIEVSEHFECSTDVIYSQCRRSKIKLATKRHFPKTAVIDWSYALFNFSYSDFIFI